MRSQVVARPRSKWTPCYVVLLIATIGGCVSSDPGRSVGDAIRWDGVPAALPTEREFQTTDDLNLPTLDESATLKEYLAYAALNNPGLEAAFN